MTIKERPNGATDPFSMVGLRVLFQASPEEMALMLAVQWLHFRRSPDHEEARGRDALIAILCTPDPDAPVDDQRPRMSVRQLDRAIAASKKRGWMKTQKTYGGRVAFMPQVPRFSMAEAEDAFFNFVTLAKLNVPISPRWRANFAPVADPNSINREVEKKRETPPESPAGKAPDPKREQQAKVSALLDAFKLVWEELHPGESYVKGAGDRRQAIDLVEAGVMPQVVAVKARAWMKKPDHFEKEKNCPFWCFMRAFNSIKTATVDDDRGGPGRPAL